MNAHRPNNQVPPRLLNLSLPQPLTEQDNWVSPRLFNSSLPQPLTEQDNWVSPRLLNSSLPQPLTEQDNWVSPRLLNSSLPQPLTVQDNPSVKTRREISQILNLRLTTACVMEHNYTSNLLDAISPLIFCCCFWHSEFVFLNDYFYFPLYFVREILLFRRHPRVFKK